MCKSLNGEIAKEVLVYLSDGIEKGIIILTEKNNQGEISIVAIDINCRRGSIGRNLINAALSWFKKNCYQKVQVVTQMDNQAACTFYEKMGFINKKVENVYHFWLG